MNVIYYRNSPYSYIHQVDYNVYYVYDRIAGIRLRFWRWTHAKDMRDKISSKYSKVKTTSTI